MAIPRVVARFNRRILNPFVRLIAGWMPPFAIVEHRGRVSGRSYRTPLMAFRTRDGLVIALTYGDGADWLRNALSAGGVRIARAGRTRRYRDPRIVRGGEGIRTVPAVVRPPLRLLNVDEFLLLRASTDDR
jgi:deazaflavin-dependent oxidoreductase (nitroreductase family)